MIMIGTIGIFGTDLPVWQAHDDCGLTERYREYAQAFRATGLEVESDAAFRGFVAKVKRQRKRSE